MRKNKVTSFEVDERWPEDGHVYQACLHPLERVPEDWDEQFVLVLNAFKGDNVEHFQFDCSENNFKKILNILRKENEK